MGPGSAVDVPGFRVHAKSTRKTAGSFNAEDAQVKVCVCLSVYVQILL